MAMERPAEPLVLFHQHLHWTCLAGARLRVEGDPRRSHGRISLRLPAEMLESEHAPRCRSWPEPSNWEPKPPVKQEISLNRRGNPFALLHRCLSLTKDLGVPTLLGPTGALFTGESG